MKRILVCTDGEEHTVKAEQKAIDLAEKFGAEITGLYVLSPFLKKFTHEIYAVNRNECRDHLDAALEREGKAALFALSQRCAERNIAFCAKMRHGDITREILAEANGGQYDLLVMGAKLLIKWRERLESFNVSLDIFKSAEPPMMFVR